MAKDKGFFKELFRGEKYRNFRFVAKYVVIWIVLCLFLLNYLGRDYFLQERHWLTYKSSQEVQRYASQLREKAHDTGLNYAQDKALIDYTAHKLNAYGTTLSDSGVSAATVVWVDDRGIYTDEIKDEVFLVIAPAEEGGDEIVRYCPKRYVQNLWDETLGVRKNSDTAWVDTYPSNGWTFKVTEYDINENEFRPVTVVAKYYKNNVLIETKNITCSCPADGKKFERVTNASENKLLFTHDSENWEKAEYGELTAMLFPIIGSTGVLYPIFWDVRYGSITNEEEIPVVANTYLLSKQIAIGDNLFNIPFTFLPGDISFAYNEKLVDAEGDKITIATRVLAPNALADTRKMLFTNMSAYGILLAAIITVIAMLRYRKLYSQRAKSEFHRTLVNSMAHDLKTPLMIMQGFGENLVENVHTEKREYYAGQILDNVKYLNGLIDKNLDLAKQKSIEVNRVGVFLMDIAENSQKRYEELLKEKKLTIKKIGDTYVHGDPTLLQTVMDNLIGNAVKYAPEGDEIVLQGETYNFRVVNKADINYGKNINSLLEPLEMGDESRLAGKGTGLGLSIANSIVAEHGWRIKLGYDKKNKIFAVNIKIPRSRK
ncbi:MAG: HAMP domain-containing histidine kinase [Lachnospiraceae bacterium]|nr:HAMP domain-containing histidine kinase [Lachnospiraceae bacterium]